MGSFSLNLTSGQPVRSDNEAPQLEVGQLISALSYALDLTGGQPAGHAVRSCVIAMHVGKELGLSLAQLSDLYYATLMKDAGCSTNASKMFQIMGTDDIAAKRDVKTTDWTRVGWDSLQYALGHVQAGKPFLERVRALVEMASSEKQDGKQMIQMRCERGGAIATRIGLTEATAAAIFSLDEHWNGRGQAQGLKGEQIPLLSRIMNLAQVVDVYQVHHGRDASIRVAVERSRRWFDPETVRAFCSVAARDALWEDLEHAPSRIAGLEPSRCVLPANDAALDNICLAFADVIDAKSPFTYRHSMGVAGAAVATAQALGLPQSEIVTLRRAALLHDIGKLSVSNAILEKPDKLTADEWAVVKKHPFYTYEILNRIPGFAGLSEIAASHHEKLDGTGYFRGVTGERLSLPARILVIADIYDALAAKRPYRDALPLETVMGIMQKDAPRALDPACLEALKFSTNNATSISQDLLALSLNVENGVEASLTPETRKTSRDADSAQVIALR